MTNALKKTMGASEVGHGQYWPQRRYRRYDLSFPVQLTVGSGSGSSQLQTTSRNVSIGGLLLQTSSPIPNHSEVSFMLVVDRENMTRPVKLSGKGRVVRVEAQPGGQEFAIAVKCSRPIAAHFATAALR